MSEDNIMRKESEIENKITNKYLQLFNEKHLEDVIHFNKIAVLHIACEMMITVYLLEMFAFLTNWFIKDPITIPLLTIFLPPLVAIPLSLVFTGLSISFFRKRVNDYSSQYSSYEYLTQRDYVNIYKQFKKDTIKIHLIGIFCYIGIAAGIAAILGSIYPEQFPEKCKLIGGIGLIGGFLGTAWNIAGYYRHHRFLWTKFYKNTDKCFKKCFIRMDINYNMFFYTHSMYAEIAALLILLGLFAIILVYINSSLGKISIVSVLTDDYGLLIIPFFSLIAFYVKKCISLAYSKNNTSIICPSLETILAEKPKD